MIAVHRQVAIAAATFVTLSIFGTQAPAQASGQSVSGKISFAVSLLPHGFNSKTCQDFRVIVEQPGPFQPTPRPSVPNLNGPEMVVISNKYHGTKITGSVKGGTVECAYSTDIGDGALYAHITVTPKGKPLGYKAAAGTEGGFNPTEKILNGTRCSPNCHFSNVDFVFASQGLPK
jgi:hypothetical protein